MVISDASNTQKATTHDWKPYWYTHVISVYYVSKKTRQLTCW